jgi:hypothetical protein
MSEVFKKNLERQVTSIVANQYAYAFDDVQCKISSSAGKATATGMLVLAATAAASALFFY